MEESRDDWTWRDTLAQLQHIDKIIETIVTRAIALNVGLLAAIAAIITRDYSEYESLLPCLAFAAFVINGILALQLARQDCIHKFYLNTLNAEQKLQYILPKIYKQEFDKENDKEGVDRFCFWGSKMHYCECWIGILIIMSVIFLFLLIVSIRLFILAVLDC